MINQAAEPDVIATEARDACLLCGRPGRERHSLVADRLFGAPGKWTFFDCNAGGCGVAWLNPRPTVEDLWKAYKTYYTHSVSNSGRGASSLKQLYHWVRDGYISSKYAYPGKSGIARAAGALMYFVPILRSDVDIWMRLLTFEKAGRVLDVGCGTGEWMAMMRQHGWEVTGIDFDPKAVTLAQETGLDVKSGSVEDQEYADESFDAVTLNHVIEHVPDPVVTLQECWRILKPGGKLFLATPNISSFGHRLFGQDWRGLEPPRHLQIFSPPSMRTALEMAGFSPKSCQIRTHCSSYVFIQSYQLRTLRLGRSFGVAGRTISKALNIFENFAGVFLPSIGECIDVLATKGAPKESL